jgi:hypothetical protein
VTVNGPKRGDLEPDLVIDLVASPTTTDLNEVSSWRILGRLRGSSTLVLDDEPTVVVDPDDEWTAVATHQWATPQTDVAGLLLVELEATWPDGHKQTFPTAGYVQVRISDDLG